MQSEVEKTEEISKVEAAAEVAELVQVKEEQLIQNRCVISHFATFWVQRGRH